MLYAEGISSSAAMLAASSRRANRYPLSVPVDITVLRSGIPCAIPGRTLNLGEFGLGVDLAGTVQVGDAIGLEFRLSDNGDTLRTKALVRHQALLRCGVEFLSSSPELQMVIRGWMREKSQAVAEPSAESKPWERTRYGWRGLWVGFVLLVILGGVGWWRWYRAWNELESGIQAHQTAQSSRTQVPAEIMENLITHKIDPIYPENARQANLQGSVVLDTVIGTDGNVVELHPVSGPGELATAAVDAVKWWRFQPYRVNGRAVPVETRIAIDFHGN